MNQKKLILLFLLCIGAGLGYSQTQVSGNVSNTQGDPVVGASITAKNATAAQGTMSDREGNFKLTVPAGVKVLVISNVGFKTVEVDVKPNLNITLEEDAATLGAVEITAEFGLKRLSRSMGSSAQNIKGTEISESGRDNFISALQGRVSGLNVTTSGGAPGASTTVVLRNITSISGNNQPLYVIDGVPMNNSSFDPLGGMAGGGSGTYSVRNLDFSSRGNDFNPEDVESVTVLKGAAAAALYGSDASNGAIIITTKKGRAGKGRVNYSNYFKWDQA